MERGAQRDGLLRMRRRPRASCARRAGRGDGPDSPRALRECMRCHRTDLRLIKQFGVCVSCYNREREWHIGQNSKGEPPAHFEPLTMFAVATETAAGEVMHHAVEARHAAEAIGVVAKRLPNGGRLSAARRSSTAHPRTETAIW